MPADRSRLPVPDGTVALVLARASGEALAEIAEEGGLGGLPLAGGRVLDFALADLARAGVGRAVLALPGGARGALPPLADHLAARRSEAPGPDAPHLDVLRLGAEEDPIGAALPHLAALAPRRVLILRGDRVGATDLRPLLAAAPGPPVATATGALGADWGWLAALGGEARRTLAAGAAPGARLLPPGPGDVAREVGDLDAYRLAHLEAERDAPYPLPAAARRPPAARDPSLLAFEAGGLALSVPRFGARRPGRWTLLEDSVLLPGARASAGVRLARAVVGPGAVVPAGLAVGEDAAEDARWFHVTPAGTTLVTTSRLAARAAALMRARGAAPSDAATGRLDAPAPGRP